jgi:large subunit ribosomal protein L19
MPEEKQIKKEPNSDHQEELDTKETPVKKKQDKKQPDLSSGMTVRVYEKIKDIDPKGKERTRVQVFEGIILAVKKPHTPSGTILVRKISHSNVGVEKIFPIHSPLIDKIEIVKQIKTRRAKLYFLPSYKKRLKLSKRKVRK